jgi:cell division protein ZapA (FtsZ GTPase activity inhibitor)
MSVDTLAYVKVLESGGVDRRVAEVHLKAMLEAILPSLATKSDIAALERRIGQFEEKIEAKITSGDQKLDGKITSVEQKLDAKITSVEQKLEAKITSVEQKLDAKIDKLEERLRATIWQSSFAMLAGGLAIGGFLIRFLK